ncbi:DUF6928 family protein [Nocardia sp. BMG111209]|uniref:DUF6928 family protein n=1 Tax=Nocardia sp. BMG111209 TaxID=1160137 RepID=UPI0003A160D9|nr:hypothetical protein [Nocardia sp. BMG111209]
MPSTASSLWYVDDPDPVAVLRRRPEPDPEAALALAKQLHPDCDVIPAASGSLAAWAGPDPGSIYIGCFPGLTVVCTAAAAVTKPTRLPELLIRPLASEHTYLVSYDVPRAWGAFAHWERGEFRRSFSATRVTILEDEGLPLVWERPYWAGEHPVPLRPGERPDPQILPFDPPDFAGEANAEWLGFHYRAADSDGAVHPGDIPVSGFTLFPKGQAPAVAVPDDGESASHTKWFGWLRNRDRVG